MSQALAGQPEPVSQAVYRIIDENFMNDSTAGEEQRQASMALGRSQAAYLAEHYIDDDQKSAFLETMNYIAAIAQTGTTDKQGNLSYYNPPSFTPGTSEYKVDWSAVMKEKAPEQYETYREAIASDNALKGLEEFINFVKTAAIEHPEWGREYQENTAKQVSDLKLAEISNPFADIDLSTPSGFMSGALGVLDSNFNEQTRLYAATRLEQFFASLPEISH